MGRWTSRSSAVVVVAMAVSSCSSPSGIETPITLPVDSVGPVPAGEPAATFGIAVAMGYLKVKVTDPVIESDESGPWLTLTVRAENPTLSALQSPQFEMHCSGNPAGGAWLPTSTFKQEESVPANSSREGALHLLLPGDDRLGEPRPSCAAPATVVAALLVFDNAHAGAPVRKRVQWVVPDDLLETLNAAPQPT